MAAFAEKPKPGGDELPLRRAPAETRAQQQQSLERMPKKQLEALLVKAAEDGDIAMVRRLVDMRVDIDAGRNDVGSTALMRAAMMGHADIVEALVFAGASVNVANSFGNTALMLAAQDGSVEVLDTLVAAGAEIDAQGQEGNSALMVAARDGNAAAVKLLLDAGASSALRNAKGNTALALAATEGHTAITALLADIAAAPSAGATSPLMHTQQRDVAAAAAAPRDSERVWRRRRGRLPSLSGAAVHGRQEDVGSDVSSPLAHVASRRSLSAGFLSLSLMPQLTPPLVDLGAHSHGEEASDDEEAATEGAAAASASTAQAAAESAPSKRVSRRRARAVQAGHHHRRRRRRRSLHALSRADAQRLDVVNELGGAGTATGGVAHPSLRASASDQSLASLASSTSGDGSGLAATTAAAAALAAPPPRHRTSESAMEAPHVAAAATRAALDDTRVLQLPKSVLEEVEASVHAHSAAPLSSWSRSRWNSLLTLARAAVRARRFLLAARGARAKGRVAKWKQPLAELARRASSRSLLLQRGGEGAEEEKREGAEGGGAAYATGDASDDESADGDGEDGEASGANGRAATPQGISADVPSGPEDPALVAEWRALLAESGNSGARLRAHALVLDLMARGVPASLRGEIWMVLSGAAEERARYPADYLAQLRQRVEESGSPFDKEIVKDLHRTLPGLAMFQQAEGRNALQRVLRVYCLRNPETVGYCQSMNLITAALLTVTSEDNAFWILASLIENRMGYYCKSMCGLQVDMRVLRDLACFYEPELTDHMGKHEVSLHSFSVSWFLCLFLEAPLPFGECKVFWDFLFLYGDELLFQMALAVLRRKRRRLLQIHDTERLMDYVLHGGVSRGLEAWALLADIRVGSLLQDISRLRAFHRDAVLDDNRALDEGTARRFARELRFGDSSEVQLLWRTFLAPAPWPTLLSGTLDSVVLFARAFAPAVFSDAMRARWRDNGLLGGVLHRLFELLDADASGKLNFEEFLVGVRVFRRGSLEERTRLCFDFCDLNGDRSVSRGELNRVFVMFSEMFQGRDREKRASAEAASLCQVMFEKARVIRAQRAEAEADPEARAGAEAPPGEADPLATLDLELFSQVIGLHPLVTRFFSLDDADDDERDRRAAPRR